MDRSSRLDMRNRLSDIATPIERTKAGAEIFLRPVNYRIIARAHVPEVMKIHLGGFRVIVTETTVARSRRHGLRERRVFPQEMAFRALQGFLEVDRSTPRTKVCTKTPHPTR